ncbi:MAG: prepilin-type N-terminal cleavage/methylation domain-containing protein [Deltaproteobacteria bacterium]|jgi:prepilin-type N-terminal cleavage/methylation domain-containing protein|nr:prepilin-type N-terminal cleavage/methylation domain-containing protein [Deltaproteobacteria bacterium]
MVERSVKTASLDSVKRSGFTLVELLVVMAIGAIVSTVAFSIFRLNSSYYLQNEDDIRLQQNLRLAIYYLSRDLRMAGSGLFVLGPSIKRIKAYAPFSPTRKCGDPVVADHIGWFRYCDDKTETGVRAIFGEDGGKDRADIVTIFRSEPEFSGIVGIADSYANDELKLAYGVDPKAILKGDVLGIVKGEEAVIFEVGDVILDGGQITDVLIKRNGRFTSPTGLPPGFSVEGAVLYNLKDVNLVTYFIDEKNSRLMLIDHDQKSLNPGDSEVAPEVVADRVEDLELHYFFPAEKFDPSRVAQKPAIDGARLDQEDPKSLIVGLTGKAIRKVGRFSEARPALFNRAKGQVKDNFSRGSLVVSLNLRNYGK